MLQKASIKLQSLFLIGYLVALYSVAASQHELDPGQPLYLTPLINEGRLDEARAAAEVTAFDTLKSYSGFITVNETYNSNTFFWYFPAETSYENEDETIPAILWQDGGPGASCMMTICSAIGPLIVDGLNHTLNPASWHKKYHIIFMDNPVEVGFSHTNSPDGHITSATAAAKEIYLFLTQFFKLFPNLQQNPFYTAGVSYGGTYTTETAYYIHQQNLDNPEIPIKLTGIYHDSPWVDTYHQTNYANVLFTAGVIGETERLQLLEMEEQLRNSIDDKKWKDAFNIWFNLTQTQSPKFTGYAALYNLIDDARPLLHNVTDFVTLNSTRKAIHVGNLKFEFFTPEQMNRMAENFAKSSKDKLDFLLKNDYNFFQCIGNIDVLTGHVGNRKMFESLTWEGRNGLVNGTREIWKVDGRIAGYITREGKATQIIMRNAGHGCILDQPGWTAKALDNFLEQVDKSN